MNDIGKSLIVISGVIGLYLLFRPKWQIPLAGKKYAALFDFVEKNYGLPHNLLARMAQQESGYNASAVGSAGEIGLLQIYPEMHPECTGNLYDPATNLQCAAEYLAKLYDQFGRWSLAIAAYNWGQGNLVKKGFSAAPAVTKQYVAKVTGDLRLT